MEKEYIQTSACGRVWIMRGRWGEAEENAIKKKK